MPLIIDNTPVVGSSRWVATESPVLFGLQRNDLSDHRIIRNEYITSSENSGGFLKLILYWAEADFFFYSGDSVSVHDATTNTMLTGTITTAGEDASLILSIPWVAGTDIDYINNNTTKPGYYFEARLTINGVVNPLTVIASPNTVGYADVDISGILQTVILKGKSGVETGNIAPENNKSGMFEVAFRECWYGSSESYTEEDNLWNYAEFVRTSSEGSNLEELTPDYVNQSPAGTFNYSNPICNLFEKPVLTRGLPFSISYLQGMSELGSPAVDETVRVVIQQFTSEHTSLGTTTIDVAVTPPIYGRLCSVNIDPSLITDDRCDYVKFTLTSKQVE
jgi:hypothetical protein